MKRVQLAIVGGGPAGLSAAIAAARTGVQVTLFDEQATAGGQLRYRILDGDTSQDISVPGPSVTGMPAIGGPQGGTRETCNWIAAAGAVEGSKATIIDRVPVYASPIDCAFAYFDV